MMNAKNCSLSMILLLLGGCTGGESESVLTTQISASSGGSISLGGANLEIPPNALESDTDVTLRSSPASSLGELSGSIGEALIIEPVDLMLLNSATITLPLSDVPDDATVEIHVLESQGWRAMDASAIEDSASVQFSVSSFGSFAAALRQPDVVGDGNRIEGTVSWPNGEPAQDVDVDVFYNDSKLTSVATDDMGHFALGDLVPGLYILEIDSECAAHAEVNVTDDAPGIADIVLCE